MGGGPGGKLRKLSIKNYDSLGVFYYDVKLRGELNCFVGFTLSENGPVRLELGAMSAVMEDGFRSGGTAAVVDTCKNTARERECTFRIIIFA